MRDKEIREGLGDLAHAAEKDHEVQMARADLYKLAKYAIKLHDMLKGVSEAEGLEGWVQSKITKSADMIGSVYHHMDYENSPMGEVTEGVDSCAHCGCEVGSPKPGCDCKEDCHSPVTEARDTRCSDKCCGADTKAEDCTCPPTCKHCNCNAVSETTYKESLQAKLSAKLSEAATTCNECGNPSWKTVSEEKKKGSHGKVCWQGYRRGKGDSCHKVKGD